MRQSRLFAPTLKKVSNDIEVVSHKYMLRAGMIRQVAAGIYNLLPVGWKVVQRIEAIVREEMNRAGAQEVLMPAVQPAELWQQSGRWDFYGPELLRFQDRKNGDFCLGPTHEEVVVDMVRRDVRSYRALPMNLYQIQTKFRDEIRPRAGLMRGREFIMKDAYSFDVDRAAAEESYKQMFAAYERIFERCGLDFRPVEADSGAIGGSLSHEFQVLADTGEDAIVSCPDCGYTANVEKAGVHHRHDAPTGDAANETEQTLVDTPLTRTIEKVSAFFSVPPTQIVKTVLFIADDVPVAAIIRGDLNVNEVKVKKIVGAEEIRAATPAEMIEATGAPPGSIGPLGLTCRVVADHSLSGLPNVIVGANKKDHHITGVSVPRDLPDLEFVDLRMAADGDPCGRCGGSFGFFRGIEVGHVFYLGTKYSEAMKCTYLGVDGEEHAMEMGCYGIGITRIMAAAIEQHHDDYGIMWPMALAPWQVHIVPLQLDDEAVVNEAERIYTALQERGVDVLIDDRDGRPGVKFKDSDLIGAPIRVTISTKSLAEGCVEWKLRREKDREMVPVADVLAKIAELI